MGGGWRREEGAVKHQQGNICITAASVTFQNQNLEAVELSIHVHAYVYARKNIYWPFHIKDSSNKVNNVKVVAH